MNKKCKKCQTAKVFSEFYTDKTKKYQLSSSCKKCIATQRSIYYENNKEKHKVRQQKWVENNQEKIILYQKEYRKTHKYADYEKKRSNVDIQFKVLKNLRSRLRIALKNTQKSGSAVADLGCTIAELIIHLESQFKEGMSWDNHRIDGWHIDHIQPLSKFDLTNREALLKACHYTNLQPLWARENLLKSNK